MVSIEVFDIERDEVIESYFASAKTRYKYALDNLYGNIDKFPSQRKKQDEKFYARLRDDLIQGCLMPPITIAFVDKDHNSFRGCPS